MSRRKLVAGNWKMNGLTADLGFVPELADMARPADVVRWGARTVAHGCMCWVRKVTRMVRA